MEELDRANMTRALELLGRDLADRGHLIEIAVYGSSAITMQFEWRRSTEGVDAVVREGFDERVLGPSVALVARELDLSSEWLNNAVGMFAALDETDQMFEQAKGYPSQGQAGLRVLLAKPSYLLAMKLQALKNLGRGDKDVDDAIELARHLGLRSADELRVLYVEFMDEDPPLEVVHRFDEILDGHRRP